MLEAGGKLQIAHLDQFEESLRAIHAMSYKEESQWIAEHSDTVVLMLSWLMGSAGLTTKE